jgi:hypothetical protein
MHERIVLHPAESDFVRQARGVLTSGAAKLGLPLTLADPPREGNSGEWSISVGGGRPEELREVRELVLDRLGRLGPGCIGRSYEEYAAAITAACTEATVRARPDREGDWRAIENATMAMSGEEAMEKFELCLMSGGPTIYVPNPNDLKQVRRATFRIKTGAILCER